MAVERLKASTGNERTEFEALNDFDKAICDDPNSPKALTFLENVVTGKRYEQQRLQLATAMDALLGLNLLTLNRATLRVRPNAAKTNDTEIDRNSVVSGKTGHGNVNHGVTSSSHKQTQ